MSITRAQVESVLAGRYTEARIEPPTVMPDDLARIAAGLTHRAGYAFFATPGELATAAGLMVRASVMPMGVDFCCSGNFLAVRALDDVAERQLLVLLGLSQHVLALIVGAHSISDVLLLAAELAAPSQLVVRRGVAPAIQQGHAPAWFLRAWERSIAAPPSSQSIAR